MITYVSTMLIIYLIIVVLLIVGWHRATYKQQLPSDGQQKSISIVVPFRNEARTISRLIESLKGLQYPDEKFEVLLVDDHSEDESYATVSDAIREHSNFAVLKLPKNVTGKKSALTHGIKNSQCEIIATTDSDCEVNPQWLAMLDESLKVENAKLVFGGVKLVGDGDLFSSLQALEFSSLIGSAIASNSFGLFMMCNGANLGFRKQVFLEVGGYEGNMDVPSGDDEFLARKILAKYPLGIKFLNSRDAVVSSASQSSLSQFFNQRLRWAGKWKYNKSYISKIVAVLIFFSQLAFIVLMVSMILGWADLRIGGLLVLSKTLLESVFLLSVARFMQSRWNWRAFITLQLIYPFYVLSIGLLSQSGTYVWKARTLSHKK